MELKLLLRVWIYKGVSCVSWNIVQISLDRRVEHRKPYCILSRGCPDDPVFLVSADVDVISRVQLDASIFET